MSELEKIDERFKELIKEISPDYAQTGEEWQEMFRKMPKFTEDFYDNPQFLLVPGLFGGCHYELIKRNGEPILLVEESSRMGNYIKKYEITTTETKLITEGKL